MVNFVKSTLPPMEMTDSLQSILNKLDASEGDVSEALALPPECYTSPEWFEFEKRAIFDESWVALGHIGNVADKGDYFSIEIMGEPLLVVRGKDDEVRVLSAVCRHRGFVLGEESGNTHSFTCPFHGWSYDLEGTLTAAPEMEGTLPFEELKKTSCLPQFRSEIWNGFIFVNFSGTAEPLAPRLKGLTKMLEHYKVDELASIPTVVWPDNPWNWKFMQENAMEPYHTHYLHTGIHDFAPSSMVEFTEFDEDDDGAIYRKVGFVHKDGGFNIAGKALMPPLPGLTDEERMRVVFSAIMPNLFIGAQSDAVFFYVIVPHSPDKITLRLGILTSYDNLDIPTADLFLKGAVEGVAIFNEQDAMANSLTHIGLKSRAAPRNRWAQKEKTLSQLTDWLIPRYKEYAQTLEARKEAAE